MPSSEHQLLVRWLGRVEYEPTWRRMQAFTDARTPGTTDELWLLEHPSVFTLGRNARPEHLLDPHGIPVVRVDRGGQVTWHGPGQLVAYLLLDLKRAGLGIRPLVELLEQAVIDLLAEGGVQACGRRDAPGVYVAGRKIAALGLRVRRGASYHGLALNVDADLAPFGYIDPCGHPGLEVTRMKDQGFSLSVRETGDLLADHLARLLGYTVRHVD